MDYKPPIIDSETFGEGNRHYFIDLRQAKNNTPYLQITRSDAEGESYKRNHVIIFENDLFFFLEALTSLMGRFSAGQTSIN